MLTGNKETALNLGNNEWKKNEYRIICYMLINLDFKILNFIY